MLPDPALAPPWPADSAILPTVQSRFLLRPCSLLNEIIVGALARAKRRYGVEISALIFLSNHLHLLAWTTDSEKLARFMGYFLSKLAREVGRLTGWHDKVFARRYQAIPISEEEAAQVERQTLSGRRYGTLAN